MSLPLSRPDEKKEESEITNEEITPKKEEITLKKEESPPKKVEENSGSWQAMWGEKEVALPADHSPFSSKRSRRGSIDLDEEVPKIISDESSNIEKIKQEVVSYESLIEKSNLLEKSMKGTDDSAGGVCSQHPCQNVSTCLLQYSRCVNIFNESYSIHHPFQLDSSALLLAPRILPCATAFAHSISLIVGAYLKLCVGDV